MQVDKSYYGKLNLKKFRNKFLVFIFLVLSLQFLIYPGLEEAVCAVACFVGVFFGLFYILRHYILLNFPISSAMIIGYIAYYFALPPVATFFEGKSLINNLNVPIYVFFNSVACLVSLVAAQYFYSKSFILKKIRRSFTHKIYKPLGYFNILSNGQLLILGVIGLLAMAGQIFISGAGKGDATSSLDRFAQAFYPLAYIPYCIFIKTMIGAPPLSRSKKWIWIIIIYTVFLLIVALGRNSRSAIFLGFMSIFLAYVYATLSGLFRFSRVKLKSYITSAIVCMLVLGPIAELSLSMVVARAERANISPSELILETINVYRSGDVAKLYLIFSEKDYYDWDETYVDNLFLSRVSNLKFSDNSIEIALNLSSSAKNSLFQIESQKVYSILPAPIIGFLGMNVDKDLVTSGSGGDFLYAIGRGDLSLIGGFKTGSIFGSGYGLFGVYYPVVFFLILLVLFPLLDSSVLVLREKEKDGTYSSKPIFNSLMLANFFTWMFYLTSAATGVESLSGLMNYILRGWIQFLLVYIIAYWASVFLITFFKKRIG